MPEFKHVGTVEILRTRLYNIDPYNKDIAATQAIVEPGAFPLMFDGYSHVWVMKGVLNGQLLRRGDGLFLGTKNVNAMLTNIPVEFPSKLFGPDDWKELLAEPTCKEGHPEQRLRITIHDKE
jgi:hypothetical protein